MLDVFGVVVVVAVVVVVVEDDGDDAVAALVAGGVAVVVAAVVAAVVAPLGSALVRTGFAVAEVVSFAALDSTTAQPPARASVISTDVPRRAVPGRAVPRRAGTSPWRGRTLTAG